MNTSYWCNHLSIKKKLRLEHKLIETPTFKKSLYSEFPKSLSSSWWLSKSDQVSKTSPKIFVFAYRLS